MVRCSVPTMSHIGHFRAHGRRRVDLPASLLHSPDEAPAGRPRFEPQPRRSMRRAQRPARARSERDPRDRGPDFVGSALSQGASGVVHDGGRCPLLASACISSTARLPWRSRCSSCSDRTTTTTRLGGPQPSSAASSLRWMPPNAPLERSAMVSPGFASWASISMIASTLAAASAR